MTDLVRSIESPCTERMDDGGDAERLREWIVTNGLGGYASGTVCGYPTRRYHGLLIAALPVPLGRTMMLSHLEEQLAFPDGTSVPIGGEPLVGWNTSESTRPVAEFRLDYGLPVWRFQVNGVVLERRLVIPHLQNTAYLNYRMMFEDGRRGEQGRLPRLMLRPLVHFRSHDDPVNRADPAPYRFSASGDRYEVNAGDVYPTLRMTLRGLRTAFTLDAVETSQIVYRLEKQRGYESTGDQWSPGFFHAELAEGEPTTLIASTERWETMLAMTGDEALNREYGRRSRLIRFAQRQDSNLRTFASLSREGEDAGETTPGPTIDSFASELVLAADQFLITPAGRVEDTARAHAAGEEVRTVIAGYHWFTDWGRDTMISLEGLALSTGRTEEAGYILRTFAHYVRDGLIPNMFPEGRSVGLYHTADASLWFFHAVDRYVESTGDRETLGAILPRLKEIADAHIRGTLFGIGVDPDDGLLRQGAPGYQLTWMDAKVDDWVVTPRRGKAVEINALWDNALRLLEGWIREADGEDAAATYAQYSEKARRSFNARFWYEQGGYLYDVVDGESGDDPACRPNQVFAIALKSPVLDESRWKPVIGVVRERLVTPLGLRSLAPGHPDYKPRYFGDLRSRDAAYHQGTVWAWLIGPFIDAWLRVHPDARAEARQFLKGFPEHLSEACLGTISEVFDAEPPYTPRGCIAQAWSVAEVLRCWIKTAEP